ncbi:GDSL-type esterase/lipase family protein [Knoellia sp. LjRoot47]|uniref:GDSL-type esterase/lipase family protein n=1 Tax=Knoellia sp. LjRoot47 TaxID=3342330 RepID=UPI003F500D21
MDAGRVVAIGDSFTEGVGDPNLHYPNGFRGWADRMARQLGRADPRWEYANLAIRSKVLDQVVADQLDRALAMEPTHVSFYVGGNDILSLRAGPRVHRLRHADHGPARAAASTRPDLQRRGARPRRHPRGDAARPHPDARVRGPQALGPGQDPHEPDEWEPRAWRQAVRDEGRSLRTEVLPLVRRRPSGRYDGDTAVPTWPEPIRPADGMKRLARERAGVSRRAPASRRRP